MTNAAQRRTASRTPRILVAAVLIVAAVVPAFVYRSLASSPSTSAGLGDAGEAGADPTAAPPTLRPAAPGAEGSVVAGGTAMPRPPSRHALGEADGILPAGATAFDAQYPGIGKLDPALFRALRKATTDAAADGIDLVVDSGWRSPSYQEQLLEQAISTYGTASEAARWVATPDTSAHVTGDAVDIGPAAATAWLTAHGAPYGLCQIYRNEPWHYELRPEAVRRGCPPMYADPTHDPRMHT